MANVNDPNGFTPSYHNSGGTIRPSEFPIQSGATGDIFSGDVVKLTSGYVLQGGATDAPLGVFGCCEYQDTTGEVISLVGLFLGPQLWALQISKRMCKQTPTLCTRPSLLELLLRQMLVKYTLSLRLQGILTTTVLKKVLLQLPIAA